jgi:SsrA-binding protein
VKIVAMNRQARHDYHVLDTYDAGLVLRGSEAKSLRQGTVSLSDAYGEVIGSEVYLFSLHIAPYKHATTGLLSPKRKRKVLLHKREIKKLYGLITQRGNTLVPLKIYFNERGFAKVTIAVCKRKRLYDKKEKLLKKEIERNVRSMKKVVR